MHDFVKRAFVVFAPAMLVLGLQGCKKNSSSETEEVSTRKWVGPEAPKPVPLDPPVQMANLKKMIHEYADGKLAEVTAAGTPLDSTGYLCFDHAYLLYSQNFLDFAKSRGINIKKIHVLGFYKKLLVESMTVAEYKNSGGTTDPAATFNYYNRTEYIYNEAKKTYDPYNIPMVTVKRPDPTSLYHAAITFQTGDGKWWYSDQNGKKPWGRVEEGPESTDAWISSASHVKDVQTIFESTIHVLAKKVLKPFVTELEPTDLNGKILPYTPPPPPPKVVAPSTIYWGGSTYYSGSSSKGTVYGPLPYVSPTPDPTPYNPTIYVPYYPSLPSGSTYNSYP